MTTIEGARLAVACMVPALVIPLRHWIHQLQSGPAPSRAGGWLDAVFASTSLAAIVGVALGWGTPYWVRQDLAQVPMLCFVFLAGWVGLACGSSLDLRVSRRLNRATMTMNVLQAAAAVASVALLSWATRFLPGTWVLFDLFHVLTLAAVCLLVPVLPERQRQRGPGGGGAGFWEPTLQAPIAVLLAAAAIASISEPIVYLQLPAPLSQVLSMELGGGFSQLLWATVAGAVAGLLMDLVSREDFAPGGLYVQMAAVILVCAGLAAMMGLSPLWIGTMAGFWSVSATLRRIDLLLIIDRGMALPRIAAPVLAGWCVGVSCITTGVDLRVAGMAAILVLLVRPLVQIAATILAQRQLIRRGGRRPRSIDAGIIEMDTSALVLVGASGLLLPSQMLGSLLFGVLIAQLVLSIGARAWRVRSEVTPEAAASTS